IGAPDVAQPSQRASVPGYWGFPPDPARRGNRPASTRATAIVVAQPLIGKAARQCQTNGQRLREELERLDHFHDAPLPADHLEMQLGWPRLRELRDEGELVESQRFLLPVSRDAD